MNINKLFDLKGKIAIVTGGANGIGKATALMLAKHGANIVIGDFNLEEAQKTAKEVEKEGVKAIAIHCNVLEDKDLVNLVETTVKEFGSIHILINNAGGGGGGRENPFKISVDDIKRDFELNVFSGWRLCQLTVPYMKKAGYGSIVFTTSMASINKSPNMSGYAGSKAAVNHTVANLAHDFGPVRINAVGPGATRTAALESVLTPEIEKTMLKHTPIKRLGTANDIAGAILYFVSPISEWVSGQTIFVNGGGEQTLE
ncbi:MULTISPECIES: glucose 1-dehydrogenase [Pasteurellaceae]|uniref:Glucose 1-dehydrogenase n=1 Tax=Pasteurella atlantica TaxID=2827233 RepID=A0AAW8CF39_9PAST|nr:glucose 1-dehydrogenase [Pasteurella atlantica]MBR0572855.1 glucose 1-dehydrogenase [Pasteurella atlantica]MDP8038783.1 glucose 1-dehydrogenase [Pasteurella atlantica]MDP8040874.1 glucose 1-dehydrogenase [Pasteurella atlantica]MDP8042952.1 glucose 1-dehydrogenase [Pasteurella atlantica]MDP8045039.1 glucose 1-dehydrogenase [Pasteurella atlantica]